MRSTFVLDCVFLERGSLGSLSNVRAFIGDFFVGIFFVTSDFDFNWFSSGGFSTLDLDPKNENPAGLLAIGLTL